MIFGKRKPSDKADINGSYKQRGQNNLKFNHFTIDLKCMKYLTTLINYAGSLNVYIFLLKIINFDLFF